MNIRGSFLLTLFAAILGITVVISHESHLQQIASTGFYYHFDSMTSWREIVWLPDAAYTRFWYDQIGFPLLFASLTIIGLSWRSLITKTAKPLRLSITLLSTCIVGAVIGVVDGQQNNLLFVDAAIFTGTAGAVVTLLFTKVGTKESLWSGVILVLGSSSVIVAGLSVTVHTLLGAAFLVVVILVLAILGGMTYLLLKLSGFNTRSIRNPTSDPSDSPHFGS